MLTNIYYYNYYKPYILKTQELDKVLPKRKKIAEVEAPAETYKVLLNKAMKSDVVNYARDVSNSVVGAKNATKNIIRDMEDFNKNIYKRGYETAKHWILEDLDIFTTQYNYSIDFLKNQKHSKNLRYFGEALIKKVQTNSENIKELELTFDENKKLTFNAEKFNTFDENRINRSIGYNLRLFNDIYNDSTQVLSEPLTEHMHFKNLGYYYNYKLGTIEKDTFKIIESGLLVDKVV